MAAILSQPLWVKWSLESAMVLPSWQVNAADDEFKYATNSTKCVKFSWLNSEGEKLSWFIRHLSDGLI